MIVVTYDNGRIECSAVEFSTDHRMVICTVPDGWKVVPIDDVFRIVRNPHT